MEKQGNNFLVNLFSALFITLGIICLTLLAGIARNGLSDGIFILAIICIGLGCSFMTGMVKVV
jgi:hypothetical protein